VTLYLKLAGFLFFICLAVACSEHPVAPVDDNSNYLRDYRAIPGVTKEEIQAVEALKANHKRFTCGLIFSEDAFENREGEGGGIAIKLCLILSEMFGIPFDYEFYKWESLLPALENGEVDFSANLAATPERLRRYFMTGTIYYRTLKIFTNRLAPDYQRIAETRPLRVAFLRGAATAGQFTKAAPWPLEAVYVDNYPQVSALLADKEIDAFVGESPASYHFAGHEFIKGDDFFPLIFSPLTLSTANAEYAPIINVVQKYLQNGGSEYIARIYASHRRDFIRAHLHEKLSPEEKSYLAARKSEGQPVRVAMDPDSYPISFYNEQEKEFQGVAPDILREIGELTDLDFIPANTQNEPRSALPEKLRSGQADVMSALKWGTEENSGLSWTDKPFSYDRCAFLTTPGHPDIDINQILNHKVGLIEGSLFASIYRQWFPDSGNITIYSNSDKAFAALKNQEIDFLMASRNIFFRQVNYQEDPDFRIGLAFARRLPAAFAFNEDSFILRSIISKAQAYVPVERINLLWNHNIFDYKTKMLSEAIPYLLIFSALLMTVLVFTARLYFKNRKLRGHLEEMVHARTKQLEQAQETLNAERLLLKDILDSCPVCFFISKDGIIKFITPFTREFLGVKEGGKVKQSLTCAEEYDRIAQSLSNNQSVNWWPVHINRADGQVREMLLNTFRADYYGEKAFLSWLIDVSELKEQARQLNLARDAAEASTRAKSEFLANMSHEIRTPMNAILGLTHLALQTELNEQQHDYLLKSESAAKSLLRIINDILDFSKIEAGKLEIEQVEFHLEDILNNSVNLISGKIHEKNLELLVSVKPNTPTSLTGDPVRLGQILNNLVSNAVKFTEKGQIAVRVEAVEENKDEAVLRFTVQDTGIGISQDQIANLFSAFTQADASTTRRYGGTGLGLVISKRLVEMMGGKIWCQSEPNKGSIFAFTARFAIHSKQRRYIDPRADFQSLVALAVDDNPLALDILREILQSIGLTVLTASSGAQALTILHERQDHRQPVNLVVMDWKMPGIDGIETTRRINKFIPSDKMPVIIMATAYDKDSVYSEAITVGIRQVLTKPISPSLLLNSLAEILGKKKQEQAAPARGKAYDQEMIDPIRGAHILLVEDNKVNQLVADKILKNAGFSVVIANNGLEALEKIKTEAFDLVLMDIQMPEMDGLTATRAIRNMPEFAGLPIVAMTAHAMASDRALSLEAGMNDHINKPIDLKELFHALARWIPPRQA
jgi:signal transduction histidine kinase/CheY-like chemotaxis protein/ABC-type amino acid transport substrate-binding protein